MFNHFDDTEFEEDNELDADGDGVEDEEEYDPDADAVDSGKSCGNCGREFVDQQPGPALCTPCYAQSTASERADYTESKSPTVA